MDHERGTVFVKQVDHADHAAPGTPSLDHQLFVSDLAGKSSAGITDDGLDLSHRAAVPGGVVFVPTDPSEVASRHQLLIQKS